MATEAGKQGRYHAAVAFHELLIKQFDKNMKKRERLELTLRELKNIRAKAWGSSLSVSLLHDPGLQL